MRPIRQRLAEMIVRLFQLPAIALAVAGVFVFGSQCLWWFRITSGIRNRCLDLWLDLGGTFLPSHPLDFKVSCCGCSICRPAAGFLVGGIALFWLGDLVKRMLNLGRSLSVNRREVLV